jgi:hypothetical protein
MRRATPFACNRSTISHKCRTERAKRSIFATTKVSPSRANSIAASSCGSHRLQIPNLRFKTGDLFNGRILSFLMNRICKEWLAAQAAASKKPRRTK